MFKHNDLALLHGLLLVWSFVGLGDESTYSLELMKCFMRMLVATERNQPNA